eukprot:scaffold1353_cov363-Pavlova_lutheri.AAC.14
MLKCKIGALSTFAAQALQASIALAMSSCWVPLRTSLSRSMVLSTSSNLSPCISTGYANRWQMSTLMCTSENVQKVFHPQAFRHVLKAWLPSLAAMSVEARHEFGRIAVHERVLSSSACASNALAIVHFIHGRDEHERLHTTRENANFLWFDFCTPQKQDSQASLLSSKISGVC